MRAKPITIDEYVSNFPPEVQARMEKLRTTIAAAAPKADECISYAIPMFKLEGKMLVAFAGYAKHIGFYPTPSAITAFQDELSAYKMAKGSVQFPLDKPMPLKLITKIVKFKVKENKENTRKK